MKTYLKSERWNCDIDGTKQRDAYEQRVTFLLFLEGISKMFVGPNYKIQFRTTVNNPALKIGAINTFETLVTFYLNTRRSIQE